MLGHSLLASLLVTSLLGCDCQTANSTNLVEFPTDISGSLRNGSSNPPSPLTQQQSNISQLLDNLLKGYDQHIRPGIGGAATVVYVDIEVRSMGPISDGDMTYAMDCYFRQSWVDRRLSFQGAMATLALSISMLERIWKPDTYFLNGKHSYLHTITTPNKFVRLAQDGTVLYSSRLTIQANCPMNLENFPMDLQRCPLRIGSFGYGRSDLVYKWNPKRRVVIASDMKLSQFDMISTPSGNVTQSWNKGKVSVLLVSFHLQRHMGYFLIEVYAPCTMLVVLSWVSFWINREATADRVALGVMTVLTMTFLGLDSRDDLPKVPYCTALDIFVAFSFVFIFATIAEFAAVHHYTKVGSGEFYFPHSSVSSSSCSSSEEEGEGEDFREGLMRGEEEDEDEDGMGETTENRHASISLPCLDDPLSKPRWQSVNFRESRNGRLQSVTCTDPAVILQQNARLQRRASKRSSRRQRRRELGRQSRHFAHNESRLNSVSKIDKVSRVVFPLVFIAMHFIYWNTYLNRDS